MGYTPLMSLAFELASLAASAAAALFLLVLGAKGRSAGLACLGGLFASLGLMALSAAAPALGAGMGLGPEGATVLGFAASLSGGLSFLAIAPVFYRLVFCGTLSLAAERAYSASSGGLFGSALCLALLGGGSGRPGTEAAGLALDLILFAEIGAGVAIAALRGRRLSNPLPRRFLRRFFILSASLFPLMAADSLGSLLGWAWIGPFDNLSLPAFLLAAALLVVLEGGRWTRSIREPANPLPDGGDPLPGAARPPANRAEAWSLLSPREEEIARLLLGGASSKEMAASLGISPKTVENHVYRIFRKTGARSRLQLYRLLGPGFEP
jgi:DNA-binding CsgD family transcriptional regulator